MDSECVVLCRAMNRMNGIKTTESCCGHNRNKYCIFFTAKNLKSLLPILYCFDEDQTNCPGWVVNAYTDCSMDLVRFVVEGPVGDRAYFDSLTISKVLQSLEPSKLKSLMADPPNAQGGE